MEVLYHIFGHILWGYSLKFRPEKYMAGYGRYLQLRILKFPCGSSMGGLWEEVLINSTNLVPVSNTVDRINPAPVGK